MAMRPGTTAFSGFSNFDYEPLDLSSKRPSIRLAILHPGAVDSIVKVTLTQAAFADRPRYDALSYTWGSPSELRAIELNGIKVDVRYNLGVALSYLRDTREPRTLWVDAICINQSDTKERNHQVKLMAHIFARAEEVLIWLGLLVSASSEGNNEPETAILTQERIEGLCKKPYWNRVWIVQEIGAATRLRVHWAVLSKGPCLSEPWENFIEHLRSSSSNTDMALKLADQRDGRHGDSFLLANLIETCQNSLCEETRDKIYGFIGIAHDCQDDSLPVDYSKSLFELYEDVIRHEYHWTKERPDMLTKSKRSIMHFSQVLQNVLGGSVKMEQDYAIAHPERTGILPTSPLEDVALHFDPFKLPTINSGAISVSSRTGHTTKNFDVFKVTGINSGSISFVGPTFSEIIGDPNESKSWKATLSNCKTDLPELRRKNEGFMRTLLELDSRDLAKICSIETGFWWKRDADFPKQADTLSVQASLKAYNQLPRFKLASDPSTMLRTVPPRVEQAVVEPRLFLTRNGVMGLMPPSIRSGDLVFQFWNTDSVAVVRKEKQYMRIVGRGVIANRVYTKASKFEIPFHWEDGEDLFVDISTLQLLTQ